MIPIMLRYKKCNAFGNILAAKLLNQVWLNQEWGIEFKIQVFYSYCAKNSSPLGNFLNIWKLSVQLVLGGFQIAHFPGMVRFFTSKLQTVGCGLQKFSYIPNPPVTLSII